MTRQLFLLILISLVLLTGCIGKKTATRYYTLASTSGNALQPRPQLHLGIGPIEIPELIDRREIIVRNDRNRVEIMPLDLWGGSHLEEIRNTLATNLASRTGTDQLTFFPFHGARIDHQIRMEILDFSGAPGKTARLDVLWKISTGSKIPAETIRSNYSIPIDGTSISNLVAGYSALLGMLADDMAARINLLDKNQ